jgi:hypothetical protein
VSGLTTVETQSGVVVVVGGDLASFALLRLPGVLVAVLFVLGFGAMGTCGLGLGSVLHGGLETYTWGDQSVSASRNILTAEPCSQHYMKASDRSRSNCNGPLSPVTCTQICNGCYLTPVTDKRGRSTPGLASATPITNVDFW